MAFVICRIGYPGHFAKGPVGLDNGAFVIEGDIPDRRVFIEVPVGSAGIFSRLLGPAEFVVLHLQFRLVEAQVFLESRIFLPRGTVILFIGAVGAHRRGLLQDRDRVEDPGRKKLSSDHGIVKIVAVLNILSEFMSAMVILPFQRNVETL